MSKDTLDVVARLPVGWVLCRVFASGAVVAVEVEDFPDDLPALEIARHHLAAALIQVRASIAEGHVTHAEHFED